MTNRYVYATIIGLVGALVVHLTIIVLLPTVSDLTAWRIIETNAAPNVPLQLSELDKSGNNFKTDPMMPGYICRFDLADGMFRIVADGNPTFWSASVHTSANNIAFSANDRIAPDGTLDIILVNPSQQRAIQQDLPEGTENAVVVPMSLDEGFVIVRAFEPDASWAPVNEAYFNSLECTSN